MPKFKVILRHWFYEDEVVEVEADEDNAPSLAKERSSPQTQATDIEYSDTSVETMYDEHGRETFFI